MWRIVWIAKHCNARQSSYHVLEQLDSLSGKPIARRFNLIILLWLLSRRRRTRVFGAEAFSG
jgi:hypothetical protein